MHVLLQSTSAPVLVFLTAAGYALATIGMKFAAEGVVPVGITLAVAGLALAVVFEILLLQRTDLPLVYIGIVVAETALVLCYAAWIGEGLSLRQMGGAAMVLAGLFAVTA